MRLLLWELPTHLLAFRYFRGWQSRAELWLRRSIGGGAMINQMLAIAQKFGIEPIIEVFAIAQANEAMQKVRDNQVRYRAVLTVS